MTAAARALLRIIPPDAHLGTYLYGSATAGGMRPDSDLDLAVIVSRRLTPEEKTALIATLRPLSRRGMRPKEWRPLEVTVVALPDVRPWRYPPPVDLQYGEWLTDADLAEQAAAEPREHPDLALAITQLREAGRAIAGPAARQILDAVPHGDVVRATLDSLPSLLAGLEDDTRNVLLTLARMWSTLATKTLRSKDAAADWVMGRLSRQDQSSMVYARDLYRHGGWGDWTDRRGEVRDLAERMVKEIRATADSADRSNLPHRGGAGA